VQQRAPLFEGCASAFMDSLLLWVESQSLSKLIFIAEAPAHRKVDAFLGKGSVFSLEDARLGAAPPSHPHPVHTVSHSVACRALGENSFSSHLISRCAAAKPPLSCIFAFSSGDPVASAFELAAEAARLSLAPGCALQQPAAWSASLHPPIDQSIFG
jgi:hypothetical protein